MKDLIFSDLYRIYPKEKYSILDIIKNLRHPGFSYLLFFRIASSNCFFLFRLFARIIHKRLGYKFGYQIAPKTNLGPGFYIGHFGTVIINPRVSIGANCNISPGVTIGKIHSGNKEGIPTIGENVWIGTNSIIVGRIKIENNVLIAPGSFVNFDVPNNSLVIGNPAKIISKENPTYKLINNRV